MSEIIVIEDNQDVRENIVEILELAGYSVRGAENGAEGVDLVREQTPDLILCDVMMPKLDGFGVLKILSKDPKTSNIPFLFLTAKTDKEDFRKGMNLGATDYITKPFDEAELLESIEIRIDKHQSMMSIPIIEGQFNIGAMYDGETVYKKISELFINQDLRLVKKGGNVYRYQNHPRHIFKVHSGRVKVVKRSDEGKELICNLYGPNDFFGIKQLFQHSVYHDEAIAIEDSELLMISREELLSLMAKNHDICCWLMNKLSLAVDGLEDRLLTLAYSSVRKRLKSVLLSIKAQNDVPPEDSYQFYIRREDLAAYVGVSKETLIRTLSDFKEEGVIAIEHGQIVLPSDKTLNSIIS